MILRMRSPDILGMNSMHRVFRIFGKVALAGIIILSSSCSDTTAQTIEASDLFGTWVGTTLKGGTTLTFKVVTGIPNYELRAEAGSFADVLEGSSNLLVTGNWSLSGRVLTLFDDAAGLPYECPALDRFEVTMDDGRTWLILDHLGDECGFRVPYLENSYQRRPDDES